jgi:hypothetical protein
LGYLEAKAMTTATAMAKAMTKATTMTKATADPYGMTKDKQYNSDGKSRFLRDTK